MWSLVKYINLSTRINYNGIIEELDKLYKKVIIKAIKDGHKGVIEAITNLYILNEYRINEMTKDEKIFMKEIKDALNFFAPYALKTSKAFELKNKEIYNIITPRSKVSYSSANYLLENSIENIGNLDASMLCLAYMRTLEIELNTRLTTLYETFKDKYEYIITNLSEHDKISSFKGTWKETYDKLMRNEGKNLELGSIEYILKIIKSQSRKSELHADMKQALIEKIKAILNVPDNKMNETIQDIINMINNENRNKFRNPPAHTAYTRLEVALECKTFVEKCLITISSCFK